MGKKFIIYCGGKGHFYHEKNWKEKTLIEISPENLETFVSKSIIKCKVKMKETATYNSI